MQRWGSLAHRAFLRRSIYCAAAVLVLGGLSHERAAYAAHAAYFDAVMCSESAPQDSPSDDALRAPNEHQRRKHARTILSREESLSAEEAEAPETESLRIRIETVEGVLLIYDAVIPPDSPRDQAGYAAYWSDYLHETLFLYGRLIFD